MPILIIKLLEINQFLNRLLKLNLNLLVDTSFHENSIVIMGMEY